MYRRDTEMLNSEHKYRNTEAVIYVNPEEQYYKTFWYFLWRYKNVSVN